MREKYIYLIGHAYANYFSKAYIVSYRKMSKQNKFTVSFLGKIPLKLKKYLKESNNYTPVPATSTADPCPTIIGLLSHLGMFVTTGCSSRRQFVATASRQDTSSRQQITDSGRQVTASGQFYKPSQTQESKYSSYALLLLCRLKCKNGSTFNERNFM